MDRGKKLEAKIKAWLRELDIYHHRFFDSRSMRGISVEQPADFWCYYKGKLHLIECKETQSKIMNFHSFRPSQLKAMMQASKYGYNYIVIIMHYKELYVLNGNIIIYLIESGKKSFKYSGYGKLIEMKNQMREYLANGNE